MKFLFHSTRRSAISALVLIFFPFFIFSSEGVAGSAVQIKKTIGALPIELPKPTISIPHTSARSPHLSVTDVAVQEARQTAAQIKEKLIKSAEKSEHFIQLNSALQFAIDQKQRAQEFLKTLKKDPNTPDQEIAKQREMVDSFAVVEEAQKKYVAASKALYEDKKIAERIKELRGADKNDAVVHQLEILHPVTDESLQQETAHLKLMRQDLDILRTGTNNLFDEQKALLASRRASTAKVPPAPPALVISPPEVVDLAQKVADLPEEVAKPINKKTAAHVQAEDNMLDVQRDTLLAQRAIDTNKLEYLQVHHGKAPAGEKYIQAQKGVLDHNDQALQRVQELRNDSHTLAHEQNVLAKAHAKKAATSDVTLESPIRTLDEKLTADKAHLDEKKQAQAASLDALNAERAHAILPPEASVLIDTAERAARIAPEKVKKIDTALVDKTKTINEKFNAQRDALIAQKTKDQNISENLQKIEVRRRNALVIAHAENIHEKAKIMVPTDPTLVPSIELLDQKIKKSAKQESEKPAVVAAPPAAHSPARPARLLEPAAAAPVIVSAKTAPEGEKIKSEAAVPANVPAGAVPEKEKAQVESEVVSTEVPTVEKSKEVAAPKPEEKEKEEKKSEEEEAPEETALPEGELQMTPLEEENVPVAAASGIAAAAAAGAVAERDADKGVVGFDTTPSARREPGTTLTKKASATSAARKGHSLHPKKAKEAVAGTFIPSPKRPAWAKPAALVAAGGLGLLVGSYLIFGDGPKKKKSNNQTNATPSSQPGTPHGDFNIPTTPNEQPLPEVPGELPPETVPEISPLEGNLPSISLPEIQPVPLPAETEQSSVPTIAPGVDQETEGHHHHAPESGERKHKKEEPRQRNVVKRHSSHPAVPVSLLPVQPQTSGDGSEDTTATNQSPAQTTPIVPEQPDTSSDATTSQPSQPHAHKPQTPSQETQPQDTGEQTDTDTSDASESNVSDATDSNAPSGGPDNGASSPLNLPAPPATPQIPSPVPSYTPPQEETPSYDSGHKIPVTPPPAPPSPLDSGISSGGQAQVPLPSLPAMPSENFGTSQTAGIPTALPDFNGLQPDLSGLGQQEMPTLPGLPAQGGSIELTGVPPELQTSTSDLPASYVPPDLSGNNSLPGLPPDLTGLGQGEMPPLPGLPSPGMPTLPDLNDLGAMPTMPPAFSSALPNVPQDNSLLPQLPLPQQSAFPPYVTDHPGKQDAAINGIGDLGNFAAPAVGADQLGGQLAKEPDVVGSNYKNFANDLMTPPGNNLRVTRIKKKSKVRKKYRAKKKKAKEVKGESCPVPYR